MKIKEKVWENRNWLMYSFAIFILIHAPKFIVNYPCWDTPGNLLSDYRQMNTTGRWFYGIAKIMLSSRYDLQWIEGVVAGIFVAFISVMMMDLLQIKSGKCRIALAVLVAAFPSMTATFVYQFCAPAYMLALFLAVLSVYVVKENMSLVGIGIASISLAFSLGCYQIYYIVALSMFLYIIFLKLVSGERLADCKKLICYFASAYIGGVVLYKFVDTALQSILNYELSSYQGINNVGNISWDTIAAGITKTADELRRFYFLFFNGSFYANYEIIIAILLAIVTVFMVFLNRKMNFSSKILVLAIMLACLPLTYFLYFVSDGDVHYHNLMVFGNIFIYIPIFIFYEIVSENNPFSGGGV